MVPDLAVVVGVVHVKDGRFVWGGLFEEEAG